MLRAWRAAGASAARSLLLNISTSFARGPLVDELSFRLNSDYSPTILIDGLWFTQRYGGISRVWSNILSTFCLPGFISPSHPIFLIKRENTSYSPPALKYFWGSCVDPLDINSIFSSI